MTFCISGKRCTCKLTDYRLGSLVWHRLVTMSAPAPEGEKTEEQIQTLAVARNALNFIEKFERYDCQEMLGFMQTHWMLSTEDFRYPTDPPMGLISNINPQNSNTCVILIPEEESVQPLDYRELHQIVRELTMGLFVLNQTPTLSLEANFDQSTTCQLPPAYQDTRIGQIMISVDYMMKALWHGCYFPKDKRTKFSEKWRSSLDVNANGKPETKKTLITEFLRSGRSFYGNCYVPRNMLPKVCIIVCMVKGTDHGLHLSKKQTHLLPQVIIFVFIQSCRHTFELKYKISILI